jgi:hypothetical protein
MIEKKTGYLDTILEILPELNADELNRLSDEIDNIISDNIMEES